MTKSSVREEFEKAYQAQFGFEFLTPNDQCLWAANWAIEMCAKVAETIVVENEFDSDYRMEIAEAIRALRIGEK